MSQSSKIRLLPDTKGEQRASHVAVPGILEPGVFQAHLDTERKRVDRSGSAFSLIVFHIEGTVSISQRKLAEKVLSEILLERTRACDAKGWHGKELAVLLPYTGKTQALSLIDHLTEIFPGAARKVATLPSGTAFSCDIYGYPEDDFDALTSS